MKHFLDEDDILLEDFEFDNEINHDPMEDVHDDAPEDWFDDEAQEDEDASKSKKKGNTEKSPKLPVSHRWTSSYQL